MLTRTLFPYRVRTMVPTPVGQNITNPNRLERHHSGLYIWNKRLTRIRFSQSSRGDSLVERRWKLSSCWFMTFRPGYTTIYMYKWGYFLQRSPLNHVTDTLYILQNKCNYIGGPERCIGLTSYSVRRNFNYIKIHCYWLHTSVSFDIVSKCLLN